jgi:hypothetical protein
MRKFNPSTLPFLAASAQSLQFAHAGYVLAGIPGAVIGLALGVVISFAVATAASRISDIAAKRKPLAYAGLVALLVLSPAAIGGASYLAFSALSVPWVRIMTACSWAIAPDAAILLSGAIAGKSLVVAEPAAALATSPQSSRKRKKNRPLEFACKYSANGCTRRFASQNGSNAHARSCRYAIPVPSEWVGK